MGWDYDFIAIGSGPAGQRGAVQAAKLGKRVAVVERRKSVGGGSLEAGTIPSKTLREAVLALAGARGRFQRERDDAPRPSAAELLGCVDQVVASKSGVIAHQLRRNDVAVVHGEASFLDPHTIAVREAGGVRTLSAEFFLIAPGTRPAPPAGVAEDGEVIITSDGILGLKKIPRSMVVVGGGVIGIEYAAMFSQLGVEVSIIERRPRPLEFLDWEIVDELVHQMRERKVIFRCGETVERASVVENGTRKAMIELQSGKRVVSELALFSVGRVGRVEALDLAKAGLVADERGRIAVDAELRTRVPHLFAAGDVIGFPALAATSSEQGRLAACHAFGVATSPMPAAFPIGIYAIPEISVVGLSEQDATTKKIPYEVGVARYRETARGQILGDESGLLKLLFHRETRGLLGVHAIGTSATELIHIGQAVLALGGGLDYLLGAVFNYPTLAECYKVAALDAANKLRE